ncbi:hypothetical protein DICPUDRAFT_78536 [Dictyostelium purpureum]|uniref:Uncharacterized protein n=1 Tax=Dictyostelium purpureum TaxID=5786 RepID=F0ZJU7_DICPU|nr:uncharacterized protein DICPUDRAFT_78536 [Dictyostelium purpureum]EGC35800.1 hypothetical protein DICPUDRAFT_78536 [Dictyostelium purpureum]|eukprot:XP_003287694.1 hypothetical protein DICPUDRAFT_78536 [Dictyostelium purpureum]
MDIKNYADQKFFVNSKTGIPFVDQVGGQCGDENLPCKTFRDVGKRALLVTSGEKITINVDASSSPISGDSLGNLYPLCNVNVQSTIQFTVSGESAIESFVSFVPDKDYSEFSVCDGPKIFSIRKMDFNNWNNIPVFYSELAEEAQINILLVNFSNSNRIVHNEPKEGISFDPNKLIFTFSSVSFSDIEQTSSDPPVYIVGGTFKFVIRLNIENNILNNSPFFYLSKSVYNASFFPVNFANNKIKNHPIFLFVDPLSNVLLSYFNFTDNTIASISQVVYSNSNEIVFPSYEISDDQTNTISLLDNSIVSLANGYLNFQYRNGIFGASSYSKNNPFIYLFRKINSTGTVFFDQKPFFSTDLLNISIEEIYISDSGRFFINASYSNISVGFAGISPSSFEYPFMGDDNLISSPSIQNFSNEKFCLCKNCSFNNGEFEVDVNPTYCIKLTETPIPSESSSSSSPSPSSDDLGNPRDNENKKKNNIIIIVVILGVASISSVVIFSIVFKRHREKKYLLNSSTSLSGSSSELGETTVASIDNDVSPNLESVIYEEDEDYAGLEKL